MGLSARILSANDHLNKSRHLYPHECGITQMNSGIATVGNAIGSADWLTCHVYLFETPSVLKRFKGILPQDHEVSPHSGRDYASVIKIKAGG